MKQLMIIIYILLIFCVPSILSGLPFLVVDGLWWKIGFLSIFPFSFAFFYVITAGLLSFPHHSAVIAGKFPRRLDHPVYGRRRLYGLCWTSVYYFTPVYWLFLTIQPMKTMLFRLFGYKGQMDFTIYPDTWIRDLPLLDFGKGAYLSNRATLGTNIVVGSDYIRVGTIKVEDGGYWDTF